MNTTPYGYENPSTGDLSKGLSGWMAQINFDIARLDNHSHNGVDSVLLNLNAFSPFTVTAPSGSWAANSGGSGLPSSGYVQTVTCPIGISDINNYMVRFIISSVGSRQYQPVQLLYARLTATTFNLYCNDNTLSILCLFR